ncbi:MAG TPA: hypothetical protein VFE15_14905 [Marmoricola sp.]|nr:hypothetical protein [Marmoricola sp.]
MELGEDTQSTRLEAYRGYYRARAARFAAQPDYPATAVAEARLAEAVEQATSMADLHQRILDGGLALEAGKAMAEDQARAQAGLYERTNEEVRALAPAEVLAGLDAVSDAAALATLGSGAAQRSAHAVTVDEITRLWATSLVALENIEAWGTARVPARWRSRLDGYVAEASTGEHGVWQEVVASAQQQEPGWRFDEATAHAARHRRLVPVTDEVFAQRLGEHRQIVRQEAD